MFIIDAIKNIKKSRRVFFTTPAHLFGGIIPAKIKNLVGKKAFYSDLSEVDGLDNLKMPADCILKSQNWATEIYNTKQTFYLVNGSSSGIIALLLSVLKQGDKIIVARNVHESIINGLVLTGAVPVWLLPEYDDKFDVAKGIMLSQVEKIYNENKNVKALFIASPTYEGIVSEVKNIAEFCKRKNILFFVDEAHGALFPFSDELPHTAILLGADACVQSLHKTTPALTGSALLHIGKNSSLSITDIQKSLNVINSTSPSWLIISSIEAAIEYLITNSCKKEISNLISNINNLIAENSNFDFLSGENHDVTKLLISKKSVSGEMLSEFLFANNLEDELVTATSVLCLCGIGTTKKKLKKLSNVLKKLKTKNNTDTINDFEYSIPVMKLSPKDAFYSNIEAVTPDKAIGRIIAENVTPYPPCIPVLVMGEVIEKKHLKFIKKDLIKVVK